MHQLSYSYQYISSFHTFHIEIEQKYNNMVQNPFAFLKCGPIFNYVDYLLLYLLSTQLLQILSNLHFKWCNIKFSSEDEQLSQKKDTVVMNIVIMHSGTTWNAKHNYFHGSFYGHIHGSFHGFFHGSFINSFWCSIANPKNGKAYICNDLNLLKNHLRISLDFGTKF